ncbi:MAG: 50S ribosomal protein L9, partial [Hyphomicrobium sp.]|uniref:50S ribosomal protein L9 n=1 Tax=Hyphomicrobium sp. TaxID=82 RepID=UPI003D0B0B13
MQVILLERIGRLGQMGDVVNVKDGYARNFLLPQKKALRATKDNIAHFETQRSQLEANNLELKKEAEAVAAKLEGKVFKAIRSAGDTGQLYGSVSTRDISEAVTAGGFTIDRRQVVLDRPIKTLGLHEIKVALHPEVIVKVTLNVARSEEEAEKQARGEDV